MEYTNEAFIKMTLALMPGTIFNDCIFDECNLIIFDDNIVTNNCKLINNKITIVERVL